MAKLLDTRVGEAFEIALQATPTAGFRWELSFPTDAAELVDFIGAEWQQMQPRLIGGSATQVFRFNAVAPGELTLVFEYRRPWEPSVRKQEAVHLRIAQANPRQESMTIPRKSGRDRRTELRQHLRCAAASVPRG